MIVLHYTAMQSARDAVERLCDPEAQVSAHYVICEQGNIWQLVDEAARAWHAGAGSWGSLTDVNSHSIGIELANTGAHPFPEPQMRVLESLCADIMRRWSIRPERVIGHSDMAPERKIDPGPRFDWQRLAQRDLSIWYEDSPITGQDPSWFRDFAQRFGYPADVSDESLLHAVRLRFRPWARGPLDAEDLKIIQDLARRFPVDRRVGLA